MAKKLSLVDIQSADNVADLVSEEKLAEIASYVMDGYSTDKTSCHQRMGQIKKAMKIAKQIKSEKSTPWPGASNVLYPLIANGSISFAARTYPEIIRNGKVVECTVLGSDPDGAKEDRAHRISMHMSAQLLVEDCEWESDTDRMLTCLPVVGTTFKKTFFDDYYRRNRSILCTPDEVIVNNNIKSLETAERITHLIFMADNDIIARIRAGIFLDIEDDLEQNQESLGAGTAGSNPLGIDSSDDIDSSASLIEQHCFIDLDEDNYAEPYIVTVHKPCGKVVRIVRRWDPQNVFMNDKDEVWRIDPVHYFTDFHFMRSPDGSYHGIGFGQLLLPINETINTLINQLIDAGTASNQQSGILAREFKSRSGSLFLSPGEFRKTDIPADKLQNSVLPWPVKEPSDVLFKLLGTMIETGRELSSVSEVMQGQALPQNAPATSVLALIEQGQKVFSAIQKRLYLSLKNEFGKLYRLNRLHLNDQIEYKQVLKSMIISKEDYTDMDMQVIPVSDPSMSSDAQRLARAQALMQVIQMVGPAGGQVILRNWLEALQTPEVDINAILPPPDPNAPPSPEQVKMMMEQQKGQAEMAKNQMSAELEAHKLEIQKLQTQVNEQDVAQRNKESDARIHKMALDAILAKEELQAKYSLEQEKLNFEQQLALLEKVSSSKETE